MDTGTSSLLVTSPDGVTWTRKDSATTDTLICISADQGTFVAVGANGTIIQSGTLGTTQTAAITAPPTTAPLPGATVTFDWDAGVGVDFYWLRVGTIAGGNDLFEGSWVTTRSQTVENLPQTGQPIYVRLFSAFGTNVLSRDYVYTAATAAQAAPNIAVEQPAGTELTDGLASIDFGNVNVGSSSAAVTFTIVNSGTASLTNLAVNTDGANSADFAVGTLGATTLAAKANTTFTVTFTPGGAGLRSATMHITSNVTGSKNPFDISLIGTGVTTAVLSLAQALNASGLTWITGGEANWTGQTATTHDGVDAAQSGSVADGQQSWMQTTVTGPGSLSFWWKVDSMTSSDYLNFEVDGVEQFFISGSVAWEQRTVSIATGSHILLWNYAKDVGTVGADAGWVDEVKWITATQPVLSYGMTAGNFTLIWNITADHYLPEYSDSLASPNWIPVGETPSTVGDNFVVTVPPGQTARFFRLHQQ